MRPTLATGAVFAALVSSLLPAQAQPAPQAPAAAASTAGSAEEGNVRRVGPATSMFSDVVWVGDTAYLSGTMCPVDFQPDKAKGTPAGYTKNTHDQAVGALQSIEKTLKQNGLELGDIVQMTAFLTGDPAKGDQMDLDGWNSAYRDFFGTASQPNRPVRATVQVAHLVLPTGRIEIMVVAARSHGGTH